MKAWSAQKWTKVSTLNHEGAVVLVERDKNAQVWLAVDVESKEVVLVKDTAEVEVLLVSDEETKKVYKKEFKDTIRASQGNSAVTE